MGRTILDAEKALARPAKIKYTKTLWRKLCAEIASGRSVREICRSDDDAPSEGRFYFWLTNKCSEDEFRRYQRARESQAHAIMDEVPDWIHDDSIDPNTKRANGFLAFEYVKKCAPKVYGDRQTIEAQVDSKSTVETGPGLSALLESTRRAVRAGEE